MCLGKEPRQTLNLQDKCEHKLMTSQGVYSLTTPTHKISLPIPAINSNGTDDFAADNASGLNSNQWSRILGGGGGGGGK